MEARIPEGDPLYLATAELLDWSKGDTDEIYAFKVVRAARYDSLAKAALDLIDEADLTCHRKNEEIAAGECPCLVCVLKGLASGDSPHG